MMTQALNSTELLRCLIGLGFVLFLLIALSYFLKKVSGWQNHLGSGFQLLATFRIGPKEKLTLVNAGGRYLLLGSGSGQINLLYDFGETLPKTFQDKNGLSFAHLLQAWTVK